MYIDKTIQLLRKQRRITQERLAELMDVSHRSASKWETGEVTPELPKLIELCQLFSCTLDALVRENLFADAGVYSAVEIRRVKPFRMARNVMVTPTPRTT